MKIVVNGLGTMTDPRDVFYPGDIWGYINIIVHLQIAKGGPGQPALCPILNVVIINGRWKKNLIGPKRSLQIGSIHEQPPT